MDYRERIYQHYSSARHERLAPQTVSGFKGRAPMVRRIIKDHFPEDRNERVVDLGCGPGAFLYFAREAGYTNVIGVDHSPEQVAAAIGMGIDGIAQGDLMGELKSTGSKTIGAIIAFDVIEHFTRPEALAFVDEVARVLKPGGRFIIHTCNGDSPFGGASFFNDFTHEICFNRNSIAQLLKSSGFKEVSCSEDAPIPHGPVSAIRWALWKTISTGLWLWNAAETGMARRPILTRNFLTVAVRAH